MRLCVLDSDPCNARLYLAFPDSRVRRDSNISASSNEAVRVIKWANRSLWLLMFISLLVVMGQFDKPYTWTFLGAVLSFLLPCLFTKEKEWREWGAKFDASRISLCTQDDNDVQK